MHGAKKLKFMKIIYEFPVDQFSVLYWHKVARRSFCEPNTQTVSILHCKEPIILAQQHDDNETKVKRMKLYTYRL